MSCVIRDGFRPRVPLIPCPRHDQRWSGRWELNPRQPAWKAGTLPLSYARLDLQRDVERESRRTLMTWPNTQHCRSHLPAVVGRQGFEPWKPMATDLQSAPFGHLGTCPKSPAQNYQLQRSLRLASIKMMGKEEQASPRTAPPSLKLRK